MLCLCTRKICGYFPHFCSYFISFILPVRPCFPSRCLWKGEMPELLPESLSWFFGKTWFPRCAMYSTHPAWAGDCLRAFVQQGWVLLSGDLFLSFPVADVSASNFPWLLSEQNNQVCAFSRFVQKQAVYVQVPFGHASIPEWLKLSLMGLQSWSQPTDLQVWGAQGPLTHLSSAACSCSLQMQQLVQQFLGSTLRSEVGSQWGSPLRTMQCGVRATARGHDH